MNGPITGHFYLDWAILALSLFNMILLLWLGGTVILNAERRTWGVALAGVGLLMAGLLFLAHTTILGRGIHYVGRWMNFWWGLGWAPALIAPFAWYVEMLWYSGFWDDRRSSLRRSHRLWLPLAGGLVLLLTLLPTLDPHPLPSYAEMTTLDWRAPLSWGTFPLLILLYPFYSVLCFGLSLDALRRPAIPERMMGELARRRARPWLVATALVLLGVSLLGTGSLLWFIGYARQSGIYLSNSDVLTTLAWLDVTVAGLIGAATLLLGQAVTSYEIFTGNTLPRRGLSRHWRSAVILAAGYGAIVGCSLALQLHPIYGLLLATILMVGFYTLFNWRSYAERERYMEHLRPFVRSQRLYEDMLVGVAVPPGVDAATPFQALCRDLLGARVAYLVALGPLSPLAGAPLVYRDGSDSDTADLPEVSDLASSFDAAQGEGGRLRVLPLDDDRYGGARWAIPLWSERGLIGVLLLGEKRDGGLYTQEEIDTARAVGERLVDTQASVAMAQKLMGLQRQQLAESQVLDRRARRVLHDDVLPLLHTAMLTLSDSRNGSERNGHSQDALSLLADAHRQIAALLREMPSGTAPEVRQLGFLGALRKVVAEEFASAFDSVTWWIEPEAAERSESAPALAAEVLFYAAREAVRNAARHGRASGEQQPPRPLHLSIAISSSDGLKVGIEDDGAGMQATGQPEGSSGQGLALHSTLMAIVGGSLSVESVPGSSTRIALKLPGEVWNGSFAEHSGR